MSTRLWCATIIYAISLVLPSLAHGQRVTCVQQYLAKLKNDGSAPSAALEAQRLVSKVAQSIGLHRSPLVIPCGFFTDKVVAWNPKADSGVPENEYIIYNPVWVSEVIGKDQVQAVALFGHELGHFLNAHFTTQRDISDKQKESEADEFAGCAVARIPADFSKLEDLLLRIRFEQDLVYPDRLMSVNTAKSGFVKCGGSLATKFKETFDGGRVQCTSGNGTEIKKPSEPYNAGERKYFKDLKVTVSSAQAPGSASDRPSCTVTDRKTKKIKVKVGNTEQEIDVLKEFSVYAHADCGSNALDLYIEYIAVKCDIVADLFPEE